MSLGLDLSSFLVFISVLVAFAYPSKRIWTLLRLEEEHEPKTGGSRNHNRWA